MLQGVVGDDNVETAVVNFIGRLKALDPRVRGSESRGWIYLNANAPCRNEISEDVSPTAAEVQNAVILLDISSKFSRLDSPADGPVLVLPCKLLGTSLTLIMARSTDRYG